MDDRLISIVIVIFAMLISGCVTFDPSSPAPPISPSSSSTSQTSISPASGNLTLTVEEVAKHKSATDCWTIINGKVLDLTSFASHPGGLTYLPYCGKDGTVGYDTKGGRGTPHSGKADGMMADYMIGTLGEAVQYPPSAQMGS